MKNFLYLLILWSISVSCYSSEQPKEVQAEISELKRIREAGLPQIIKPNDRTFNLIMDLGDAKIAKSDAAQELIEWVFVEEPKPDTTEAISRFRVHPAAASLIGLGNVSVPVLTAKFDSVTTEKQAEILAECLDYILKDQGADKLNQIRAQHSSTVVKAGIQNYLLHP